MNAKRFLRIEVLSNGPVAVYTSEGLGHYEWGGDGRTTRFVIPTVERYNAESLRTRLSNSSVDDDMTGELVGLASIAAWHLSDETRQRSL